MIFSSTEFLFFLPFALLAFYVSKHFFSITIMKWILIISSLFFYGWNTPWFIFVLSLSTIATFLSVKWMQAFPTNSLQNRIAFYCGLAASLGNLIFWKYTGAIFSELKDFGLLDSDFINIILPLGISFYTFQQLTYVMDARSNKIKAVTFTDYFLFISFFPQLVVGPIVRHDEILPQVMAKRFGTIRIQNILIGSLIFLVGLAKKVILADNISLLVDPIFLDIEHGFPVSTTDAWIATIGYTLQLYFDFSGYSDMAIGIARMFGLKLPENFYSPLKATSILDFWRRWHITLTRMTTRYVFNPISIYTTRLAVSLNLSKSSSTIISVAPASFVTFVLIGLWHGASLTFLLFGVLHSCMAIIEYLYFPRMLFVQKKDLISKLKTLFSRIITLFLVMISLILFRSPDLATFISFLETMLDFSDDYVSSVSFTSLFSALLLFLAFIISQISPNSSEIFLRYRPAIKTYTGNRGSEIHIKRHVNWKFIFFIGFLTGLSLLYMLEGTTEFLYADF